MALPLAERRDLGRAHIVAQERIRTALAAHADASWRALPSYNRADIGLWLSQVLPPVKGAQVASSRLVDAFVARCMQTPPTGVDSRRVTGAAVRGGVPPRDVYSRPFHTLWKALADGVDFNEGSARAAKQIGMLTATDTQFAMRQTLTELGQPVERLANQGACDLCMHAERDVYPAGDQFPLHPHCGCGPVPLVSTAETGQPPAPAATQDPELGALLSA